MKKIFYLLVFFVILSKHVTAQENRQSPEKTHLIGLTETPPFVMEKNGRFSGLSIDSWEMVNKIMELKYEYKMYSSLQELLNAIETNQVDFSINPVTVTDRRMQRMNFSQPYFISHTGVAKKKESLVWGFLKNLWSWNFISALLILLGVIFIFGFFVWIFERERNKEQFGGGLKGIMQGFWWSAVTMTTVGYGDKAPRTAGGRIIGLIWMFIAIIMISSLTAGIASSLTVKNINDEINSVEDLNRFKVTTVGASSAEELLNLHNIQSDKVIDERQGIQKLLDNRSVLFVYDEPILKYEINRRNLEDKLEVLPKTLKKDYYSYSFPKDSALLDEINPALVSILKTMEWNILVSEYK